jgi:hypothetical protein
MCQYFPMKQNHENPFDSLVELELFSGSDEELFVSSDVLADLRCDEEEIELEDYSFYVGIRRAHLQLDLAGCDILPGTRLNDHSSVQSAVMVQKRGAIASSSVVKGSLSASRADVDAQGSWSKQRSSDKSTLAEVSYQRNFVTSRPGKKWEVRNPSELIESQCLSGTFLSNDRLCEVQRREGSNLVEVSGKVLVRRRDLTFRVDGNMVVRELRGIIHKEKFMKAVVAKSLVENTGQEESELQVGALVIARSTISSED